MKEKFYSTPIVIGAYSIIHIPIEISQLLPSRGLVIGKVTLLSNSMVLPLEPDGYGCHWFDCSNLLSIDMENTFSEPLEIEIDTDVEWYEPELPDDLFDALKSKDLIITWESITTKAKWEWIRWVRSAQQDKTRETRVRATCDKLSKGMKRPCCFDQTKCSIPEVSKNGKLII